MSYLHQRYTMSVQDEAEFWHLPQNPIPYAIIEHIIEMGHDIKYRVDYTGVSTPICDILSRSIYSISVYFRDDHIHIFNWIPATNVGIDIPYADPRLFELIDRYLEL